MDPRVEHASSLLKGRFNPDIANIVKRDSVFLGAVTSALGLDGNDLLQQAQVATLLGVMGVMTANEYPKWVGGKIVQNKEEDTAPSKETA